MSFDDVLDTEAVAQTLCMATEDCREGIAAFKENAHRVLPVINICKKRGCLLQSRFRFLQKYVIIILLFSLF